MYGRQYPLLEAGFSLIEVIVSAAVLAHRRRSRCSPASTAQTASTGREKARAVAADLAEQDQESLRSMPVDSLATTARRTRTMPGRRRRLQRRLDVEWVRDDTGGTVSCTNDGKQADYLHITSTVSSNARRCPRVLPASS